MQLINKNALREQQNLFLLCLAVLLFATVISLSAVRVDRITAYLASIAVVYFALASAFRVRSRRKFNFLAAGLLVVFVLSIISSV